MQAAPPSPMRLRLTLFDPNAWRDPAVTRVVADGCTIGRAPDNDWVLEDPRHHLSDRHCVIAREPEGFMVTDTSTGGVFLNEAPTPLGPGQRARLAHGDRLALGDYLVTVAIEAATAEAPAPPQSLPSVAPPVPTAAPDEPDRTPAPTPAPSGPRISPEDRPAPPAHRRDRPPLQDRRGRDRALAAALAGLLLLGGALAGWRAGWWPGRPAEPPIVAAPAVPPPPVAETPPPVASPPALPAPPALLPAAPAPATGPQPPPVDRRRLQAALGQLFRLYACADLAADVGEDGSVTVTGFVARGEDLSRLYRGIAALPDAGRLDSRVTVQPWPFCEIARLLRSQTAEGPTAPVIEPSHPDHVYREGDALQVTAIAQATVDSFLTVDFFDTDGRVVHLLPTTRRPDNRVNGGQRVRLGAEPGRAGRGERVYVVSPPFGTGMIVALSSMRPLFPEPRPEQEEAGAYLAALAASLMRDPAGSSARITSAQQAITLVAR